MHRDKTVGLFHFTDHMELCFRRSGIVFDSDAGVLQGMQQRRRDHIARNRNVRTVQKFFIVLRHLGIRDLPHRLQPSGEIGLPLGALGFDELSCHGSGLPGVHAHRVLGMLRPVSAGEFALRDDAFIGDQARSAVGAGELVIDHQVAAVLIGVVRRLDRAAVVLLQREVAAAVLRIDLNLAGIADGLLPSTDFHCLGHLPLAVRALLHGCHRGIELAVDLQEGLVGVNHIAVLLLFIQPSQRLRILFEYGILHPLNLALFLLALRLECLIINLVIFLKFIDRIAEL